MGEVFRFLRNKAREAGVASPIGAGIAVLQRAGNAIDLNPHVHAIVPDAVYRVPDIPDAATTRLDLVPLAAPGDEDLVTVSRRVCARVLDLLKRRGLADADRLCPPDEPPPMGPLVEAAARVPSRFAYVDDDGNVWPIEERVTAGRSEQTGAYRGFSTHAGVAAPKGDLARQRRIVRYCLKPPIAEEQVSRTRDGRIAIELHRAHKSGATHVVLDEMGLVKKLAAIVAPPAVHRVRYFGAFASASKHRPFVVPPPPLDLAISPALMRAATGSMAPPIQIPRRTPWLAFFDKVYGTDSIVCPSCKTRRLRVVSAVTEPATIRRILDDIDQRTSKRALFANHDPTLPAP